MEAELRRVECRQLGVAVWRSGHKCSHGRVLGNGERARGRRQPGLAQLDGLYCLNRFPSMKLGREHKEALSGLKVIAKC